MPLSLSEIKDWAMDACYRAAALPTELSRLEDLSEQYRRRQALLLPPAPKPVRKPCPTK